MYPSTRRVGVVVSSGRAAAADDDEARGPKRRRVSNDDGSGAISGAATSARENLDQPNKGFDVIDYYTCSICLDVPRANPIQCRNGHICCLECSNRQQRRQGPGTALECPVCRTAMDPANPIQCLLARQMIERAGEHDRLIVECCGDCGWTTVKNGNSSKTPSTPYQERLASHERTCAAALATKIDQLEKRQKEAADLIRSQATWLDTLQGQLAAHEQHRAQEAEDRMREQGQQHGGGLGGGSGCATAAWLACVTDYRSRPLEGAEIFVAPPTTEQQLPWLRLHCRVPGTGLFDGIDLGFIALYNPITRQARQIRSLHRGTNRYVASCPIPFEKPQEEEDGAGNSTFYNRSCTSDSRHVCAEMDLRDLLTTMRTYRCEYIAKSKLGGSAVETEEQTKRRQEKMRCEAFDEAEKWRLRDGFVSLDRSRSLCSSWFLRRQDWQLSNGVSHPAFDGAACQRDKCLLPNTTAPPTKTVTITNLPFRSTETDVKIMITDAGFDPKLIASCKKALYKTGSRGRRDYKVDTATVEMTTSLAAYQAFQLLHRHAFRGRPLAASLG